MAPLPCRLENQNEYEYSNGLVFCMEWGIVDLILVVVEVLFDVSDVVSLFFDYFCY